MEEGDVNAPNAEGIIRQVLYGNNWFRKEFGKASAEYMLPDCFGFPASLPSILAHAGVKGFSTQKLVWGSSAPGGGPDSLEKTPENIPFDVGVWVGPDGNSIVAALNPGDYVGNVTTDLSKPLPPPGPLAALDDVMQKLRDLGRPQAGAPDPNGPLRASLNAQRQALARLQRDQNFSRYQGDWAARVEQNGKVSGVFTDYHYFGTGDIGGAPKEDSVKMLESIVTKSGGMGDGPVRVIPARADQMFLDLTPAEIAGLPRFSGEMELTNHSAGSLTSEAYVKRWLRKQETLADAAEKASIAAEWLGGRKYPLERLNNAWTLAMGSHFHDIAAGTASPKAYEFAWNDQIISLNQFASVLSSATETAAAALNTQTAGIPVVVYNVLNVAREDIVEAKVDLPAGTKAVRVTGPDGKDTPAQLSGGKVLFLAKAPSVGYAVYDISPAPAAASSTLTVSESSLENQRYRVTIDSHGDVSSIFDKSLGRELLSAPARLAISYDNPAQWPAWNMDWDQEQAAPRSYVGGAVKVRVVENGPVRVAVEITRETEGSKFVQTISLAAGDAGNRVAGIQKLIPVSYTHLDVYKRQLVRLANAPRRSFLAGRLCRGNRRAHVVPTGPQRMVHPFQRDPRRHAVLRRWRRSGPGGPCQRRPMDLSLPPRAHSQPRRHPPARLRGRRRLSLRASGEHVQAQLPSGAECQLHARPEVGGLSFQHVRPYVCLRGRSSQSRLADLPHL